MPGNEVGGRVHNFFQQGNLSQNQHQTQAVEENWSGFNSELLGGNEWQTGEAVNSKIHNAQQSGSERGQGNQFSLGLYGLNFAPSDLRPDFAKSLLQNQQFIQNGFGHRPQVPHAVQNEVNGLGMGAESARHNLMSSGIPILESQQRAGPQHSNLISASVGSKESPINFNILGGQQQMRGQHLGIFQPLARQQYGMNDGQLIQQQVMLKQMQELQRQQQMQQLEAMQRNPVGPISPFSNHGGGNHAPTFISGTPMHDPHSFSWSPQVTGPSPQGYSNGMMISPEQGHQALHLMGLLPQQASQSLYGVPVSSALSGGSFMPNQVDKAEMQQMPIQGNLPFSPNQHPIFLEQGSLQQGTMMSRLGFEGKVSSGHASSQGSGRVVDMESFNQMQQPPQPQLDGRQRQAISSSPSLPDQTAKQVGSSQVAVALDPTEEKILFGSDDNVEAFGGSLIGSTGGQHQSEGTFPSIQSGSWSALMQSAVAESSSSDGGVQGEWSGVGVRYSGSLAGNQQLPVFPDSGKLPPSWVYSSQMASLTSRPVPNDASLSSNYHNSRQQPYVSQRKDSLQTRSGHQSSEEVRTWLDHNQPKMVAQGIQAHESTYSPGDSNSKSSSSCWIHRQRISSHGDRPSNRLGHGEDMPMLGSLPNSNIGMGRHQMNSKDDAMRISSNIKGNQDTDIAHVHLDSWKPGSSTVRPGADSPGKYQQHLNKVVPQVLDSSMNSCDRGTAEMHEVGNSDNRENSSDSYGSYLSNRASAGGSRENICPDVSDRHGLSGNKQNSSGQASRRTTTPAPRKFQYHPMGEVDIDMEHSYGTKNMLLSQALTHNLHGVLKRQEGHSKFLNPTASNTTITEKGFVPNVQGDIRVSCGVSSRGISLGFVSAASAPVDKSSGIPTPSHAGTSSGQRMLELLHKVDQSTEQSAVAHVNANDLIKTATANETAAPGNAGLGLKQSPSSSSSQGFSLQLAPPSQGLRAPNLMMASQSPSQTVNSPNPSYVAFDKGDKTRVWLSSVASNRSLPTVHQNHQGESHINMSAMLGQINIDPLQRNMQINFPANFASGYKSSMLQNQQMKDSAGNNSHNDSALQRETGQPSRSDQSDAKVSMQQMPMMDSSASSQPSVMPGVHQKGNLSSMIPNVRTNMLTQQRLLDAQSINPADLLKTRFHSNETLGINASNFQQKQVEKDALRNGDAVKPQGFVGGGEQLESRGQLDPIQRATIESKGKEASVLNFSDASNTNAGTALKDIEAFGGTLKPNSDMVDNYTFLHQVQAMKDLDPNNRQVKRFKGPENGSDDQQMVGKLHPPFCGGSNDVDTNSSINRVSGSSVDAKILSFSPEHGTERENHFQLQGNIASHNLLPAPGDPQKLSGSSAYSQISHQMAPTWFKHYGTLKNGQLLQVHDAHRAQAVTNMGQQFIIGKGSKTLGSDQLTFGQVNAVCEHLPSHHSLVSGFKTPRVDSLRPKKRKSATVDLLPWYKEVALASQGRFPNISLAEDEWAQASHRLFEKIEDEVYPNEDLTSRSRPRRRLVLTSQLMQQILRPPPREILSLDASTNCETITFFVARLALGDACSLVCQSESNSSVTCDEGNQSEKKTRDRISYQYLTRVTEDFISRASMLENEFSRLEKRVSFLDLRLECQDLERFSIINRFARFHGRGQVDGAESSSLSDPSMATQRARPLRYVNAYPNPRNLPERVQCFTL